jgi:hypothetical protein
MTFDHGEKRKNMSFDLLFPVGFLLVWLALQLWVLPAMGFRT